MSRFVRLCEISSPTGEERAIADMVKAELEGFGLTVEEVAEPFLVREGLLARTPRGRIATPAAWAHLGLTPPRASTSGNGQQDLFGA